MANAHALNFQRIQAVKRVLKGCLDKLVIGILYDEGWNPLILNNRLCFGLQAIPDMELRTRAANSWNEYRSKFYHKFLCRWTLQGRKSAAVEIFLMSLRQEFKGPKWDMKVNKLISLSTEKRYRMMAEGKLVEAEALNNALRKTVPRITDYGLGDENMGFELIPAMQIFQPKESKTKGRADEAFYVNAERYTSKTEYTHTTQMFQPKECKSEVQLSEGDFAYAEKFAPHPNYGLGFGSVRFESTFMTQLPQSKENKTKGQMGEESFAYANESEPHPNHYLINTSGVEFQSTQITQSSQSKESITEAQSGEEVFAYGRRKFTLPRKRINEADAKYKPNPAKKARKGQPSRPSISHHSGTTGSELSGKFDSNVAFVHTRKRAANNPRTKQEAAISIPASLPPSITSSQLEAVMAELVKETTESLDAAIHTAFQPEI